MCWTWRWMISRIARRHRLVRIVLEDLDRGLQRLQRVAQLVGEDREELVLAAIGLGQLLHLALHRLGLEPPALRDAARARERAPAPGAAPRPCSRSSIVRSCSWTNTRRLRAQHLGRIGLIRKSNAPSS